MKNIYNNNTVFAGFGDIWCRHFFIYGRQWHLCRGVDKGINATEGHKWKTRVLNNINAQAKQCYYYYYSLFSIDYLAFKRRNIACRA